MTEIEKRVDMQRRPRSRKALLAGGMLTVALSLAACDAESAPADQAPVVQPSPLAKSPEGVHEKYPVHTVVATVFWVGEPASRANNWIDNISTEWESDARKTFGGFDDPRRRTADGLPAGFMPKENPYYVALPASEFTEIGMIPAAQKLSYWKHPAPNPQATGDLSIFKGRWVEITTADHPEPVYAQWLDTGPGDNAKAVRDYDYVFGTEEPKNQFGLKAGIDLSPTTAFALGVHDNLEEASLTVAWRFVDESAVPDGPWRDMPPIDNVTHW